VALTFKVGSEILNPYVGIVIKLKLYSMHSSSRMYIATRTISKTLSSCLNACYFKMKHYSVRFENLL